jgi:hypothetical protein
MRNITEESQQIPELYALRNKHNKYIKEMGYDYSNNLLKNTLSPVLYRNNKTAGFLQKLNDMVVTLYDSVLPVRNIFSFTQNKYYNKHGR